MKQWKQPEMLEIEIVETAYSSRGEHLDGGYTGDLLLSGHSTSDGTQCVGKVETWYGKTIECSICNSNSNTGGNTDYNS